jgi:hypothetical protein
MCGILGVSACCSWEQRRQRSRTIGCLLFVTNNTLRCCGLLLIFLSAVCVSVNHTATTNASYTCDLGSNVTWAAGDRIKLSVPTVAAGTFSAAMNRAFVIDDRNRSAHATAPVSVEATAPVSSLCAAAAAAAAAPAPSQLPPHMHQ